MKIEKQIPTNIADNGKVRIGNASPPLPPISLPPASIADNGKVRIGNASAPLPPKV